MMKKLIAFGASNSQNSINKSFATFAAKLVKGAAVKLIDLNDYEMPIFSVDREDENGIHQLAFQFKQEIIDCDGIIISFAEHNGAYSAAFKNIYDWVSRIAPDVWEGKPMYLLATAPGAHGGKSVLEIAFNRFSRRNKDTIFTFSLPEFGKNFSLQDGITDRILEEEFMNGLQKFEQAL